MKIGNVYFYQTETKMFVPLLDENLEGDVFGLFIEVKSMPRGYPRILEGFLVSKSI